MNRNKSLDTGVPPIFQFDNDIREHYPVIAGIDEAGRGPLAGPVVAAAVILPSGCILPGIRDSKKTSEKERKKLFWDIFHNAESIGVGIIGPDVIDEINILEATKSAMITAVQDLTLKPDILLIDAVKLTRVGIVQKSMCKGESVSASIAAASIVAKVVRDDIMMDFHEKYPVYKFKSHKGYSTKAHMELINEHGPCPIHRRSFNKVKDVKLTFG
ncbi:MAG: ribonuclease HII [Nitrospiraceae bacterium]|nr:MAG: ribonuclease HII [Nitrospiraceae bacterium]